MHELMPVFRICHAFTWPVEKHGRNMVVYVYVESVKWFEGFVLFCFSFQFVYREVEKKPVVGIEDLSSHQISMTSSLLNTQSKCEAFGLFHARNRWLYSESLLTLSCIDQRGKNNRGLKDRS